VSKPSTTRREAHTARVVLRMIENREHKESESARERVMAMMAALDAVLLHLPDDPPDAMVAEIERVVTTLRTADVTLSSGNISGGLMTLDLARARLDRFVQSLEPPE